MKGLGKVHHTHQREVFMCLPTLSTSDEFSDPHNHPQGSVGRGVGSVYSHFTHEETEAQRGEGTCSGRIQN